MQPVHLHLLYFGSGRYVALLRRLIHTLQASGCALPWSVLTDAAGAEAIAPEGWPVQVVDPRPWVHLIRPGNPGEAFDRKSTYILALAQQPQPGPFAVLDCDNVVEADPAAVLLAAAEAGRMAMAECPADPPIPVPCGWHGYSGTLPERTSALLLFPTDARLHARLYAQWFLASRERDHYLLEQRTWSLVWHDTGGEPLPRSLSWSRFWGDAPPGVHLRHLHGEQKWQE